MFEVLVGLCPIAFVKSASSTFLKVLAVPSSATFCRGLAKILIGFPPVYFALFTDRQPQMRPGFDSGFVAIRGLCLLLVIYSLWEVLRVLRSSPLLKNQHFYIPILSDAGCIDCYYYYYCCCCCCFLLFFRRSWLPDHKITPSSSESIPGRPRVSKSHNRIYRMWTLVSQRR